MTAATTDAPAVPAKGAGSDAPRSSRKRYAGHAIGTLRTPPGPLPGPDEATLLPDEATLLPDPVQRYFAAQRQAWDEQHSPTAREIKLLANFVTFALRNDLPSVDARDAAVLWEKWRRAVADLRDALRRVTDDDLTTEASSAVWDAAIALDHRGWDLRDSLALALRSPGEVFERFCPWRASWATFERIHPEAV